MTRWLWRGSLLLLPLAVAAHFVWPHRPTVVFVLSALSLMPLAKSIGDATEELAERVGPTLGSLLNVTFGNAAELILGISALMRGHVDLVKGSLTGSIVANLLLVGGAAIVAGGIRFPTLRFNRTSAGAHVSTLFLAVVALAVPAMLATAGQVPERAKLLSEEISAVLVVMYALSLLFQLRTHAGLLDAPENARTPLLATPAEAAAAQRRPPETVHRPLWASVVALTVSAGATAVASELLVGALEGTLEAVHLPEAFVGVVIVAVVGNAAEHSTAVLFGRRGNMDVALGIAWESSKQIALFVAPVLVFTGMLLGAPMDLAFRPLETVAVGVAVLSTALIALDGETHWLEGAFLLAVYAVLGLGFWFVG
jgi:Ca2+:H+ antiporter